MLSFSTTQRTIVHSVITSGPHDVDFNGGNGGPSSHQRGVGGGINLLLESDLHYFVFLSFSLKGNLRIK